MGHGEGVVWNGAEDGRERLDVEDADLAYAEELLGQLSTLLAAQAAVVLPQATLGLGQRQRAQRRMSRDDLRPQRLLQRLVEEAAGERLGQHAALRLVKAHRELV